MNSDRLRFGIAKPRLRTVAFACAALIAAGLLAALAFEWGWLRSPLEHRLSANTGREVSIAELTGRWDQGPRLRLRNVTVSGNGAAPLFKAREVSLHVAPWPLLIGRVELVELGLAGAVIDLQRDADGKGNWPGAAIRDAEQPDREARPPGWQTMKIGAVTLSDVVLSMRDAVTGLEVRARADSQPESSETSAWTTRYQLSGHYRKTPFAGQAYSGTLVTLRDTGIPFPFKGHVDIGRTKIEAEGGLADLLGSISIDTRLAISGPSLSTLYPTIPLALPSTPPYRLQGRLRLHEDVYLFDDISGHIGRSDMRGYGVFELKKPRPLLTASLDSNRLALADLGVMIGVPADEEARRKEPRVLPDAKFDLPRMNAMNADVVLDARQLIVSPELPLEDLSMKVEQVDGLLRLRPLKFGFAGGEIVSDIALDARSAPMKAEGAFDFRKVSFARLFPTVDRSRLSAGELGAQIRLEGRGQSVAEVLGSSSGTVAMAMSGGLISHTVVAAATLDGGQLLPLLIRGDQPIAIRCAAVSLVVEQGVGRTQVMVLDTETARVDGSGAIDLAAEQFEMEIDAKPKQPSILSVRAPLHVEGSFRRPRVTVSSGALLRGGVALALGVINPLAALIPLIETGPGEDTNCQQVLAPVEPALKQSKQTSQRPPSAGKVNARSR
jgi:AsmA family protein